MNDTHRRAERERFFQLHKNCQDLTFFSDQKRRNIEALEKNIYKHSKSKGNEHFRLGEQILYFPNVYFDFDLLKMFPNVFSSQITSQTFQTEMPFQTLESKSLACWSGQIFQLSPNFLHQYTAGRASFVQQRLFSEIWAGCSCRG